MRTSKIRINRLDFKFKLRLEFHKKVKMSELKHEEAKMSVIFAQKERWVMSDRFKVLPHK